MAIAMASPAAFGADLISFPDYSVTYVEQAVPVRVFQGSLTTSISGNLDRQWIRIANLEGRNDERLWLEEVDVEQIVNASGATIAPGRNLIVQEDAGIDYTLTTNEGETKRRIGYVRDGDAQDPLTIEFNGNASFMDALGGETVRDVLRAVVFRSPNDAIGGTRPIAVSLVSAQGVEQTFPSRTTIVMGPVNDPVSIQASTIFAYDSDAETIPGEMVIWDPDSEDITLRISGSPWPIELLSATGAITRVLPPGQTSMLAVPSSTIAYQIRHGGIAATAAIKVVASDGLTETTTIIPAEVRARDLGRYDITTWPNVSLDAMLPGSANGLALIGSWAPTSGLVTGSLAVSGTVAFFTPNLQAKGTTETIAMKGFFEDGSYRTAIIQATIVNPDDTTRIRFTGSVTDEYASSSIDPIMTLLPVAGNSGTVSFRIVDGGSGARLETVDQRTARLIVASGPTRLVSVLAYDTGSRTADIRRCLAIMPSSASSAIAATN
jgi:hypothetical protein